MMITKILLSAQSFYCEMIFYDKFSSTTFKRGFYSPVYNMSARSQNDSVTYYTIFGIFAKKKFF